MHKLYTKRMSINQAPRLNENCKMQWMWIFRSMLKDRNICMDSTTSNLMHNGFGIWVSQIPARTILLSPRIKNPLEGKSEHKAEYQISRSDPVPCSCIPKKSRCEGICCSLLTGNWKGGYGWNAAGGMVV